MPLLLGRPRGALHARDVGRTAHGSLCLGRPVWQVSGHHMRLRASAAQRPRRRRPRRIHRPAAGRCLRPALLLLPRTARLHRRYMYSLYFAVAAFTGLGDNDFFVASVPEACVMAVFLLFNLLLAAYILGTSCLCSCPCGSLLPREASRPVMSKHLFYDRYGDDAHGQGRQAHEAVPRPRDQPAGVRQAERDPRPAHEGHGGAHRAALPQRAGQRRAGAVHLPAHHPAPRAPAPLHGRRAQLLPVPGLQRQVPRPGE